MILFSLELRHIDHRSLQDRPTYSHAEQYQSWKDTPTECPIAGSMRLFVPQRMYKPHTGSDRRRYVEEVRLSPPIIFEVEHPTEWGITLDDALKSRTKRLLDKDALMFEGCGPSVSIRLEVRSHIPLLFYRAGAEPAPPSVARCTLEQTDSYQGLPEPSRSHYES
jgi:hypothetical protein